MTPDPFRELLLPVVRFITGLPLDKLLERALNAEFPPDSVLFRRIRSACLDAISAGWMCSQGEGNRRFGRIFEPASDLGGFSVDVVDITDRVGNHHRHPTGEIDMIMPMALAAKFDGCGAGWLVYAPDSAHKPTVTGGRALILYLLPGGSIEWSKP